ncbi:unnamed protein product [Rotaria socialis]
MAIHSSIQLDVEIIEEEESSNEIEYEPAAESKNSNSISRLSSNTMEKKTISSKSKRYCKFNKEWIKISKYASFLQECRSDSSLAHCCVCKSNFSIANGGKYLIDRHLEQASHKRLAAIEAENKSRLMFDFIHPPSQLTSMIAAELTLVYHGIRHAHSYNSQSCTVDVSKKLFHDSTIAKNISCGRTKARELAVNVLAPYFSSKIIKAINQNHFYSLSFDASNKGHKKMFPFIINYYTMERGIVRSVIEVIEQPHETANHVVASLREVLEMNNIDIKKMTSIGADNTNVNYGQYHSAFSLLKSDFPNLIKGFCDLNQIKFHQIEKCIDFLRMDIDRDKLFDEMSILQSKFKELNSYRESLSRQISQYINNDARSVYEEFNNDLCNESHDEDNLIHKPTTENHEREMEFRSDQFWSFLLAKSKPMCIEMHKIISYVYSIPCSNAFVEGVFSHMKSAWTASRNSMVNETIAAELKIRLNSTMACEDFFSFAQTQPQLIKCAKSQQKYSFEKKRATVSVNINREGSLRVNILLL